MNIINFRNLRADEIEVRVGTVSKSGTGFSLLLYQDARAAMTVLDETVGVFNWQKSYSRDNANCTISIWDEDKKQWISKEDTGTESNTEKEKGKASDAFKRTAVNWGIGRELYSAPFIWINGKDTKDKFIVKEISYEGKKITGITIYNTTKKCIAYNFGTKNNTNISKKHDNSKTKDITCNLQDAAEKSQKKQDAAEEITFKDKNGNYVLCQNCGSIIPRREIAVYSYNYFNKKTLCMDCQKIFKTQDLTKK